jgi:hypothetical protein
MTSRSNTSVGHESTFWPQPAARLAGFLYLVVIIAGGVAEIGVRQRLVVVNDAAGTANAILAHEQLFRWGLAADLLGLLCVVPLIVLLYELLRVASQRVALLSLLFSTIGAAIQSATLIGHFAPLTLLKRGVAFGVNLDLLQAQTYMAIQLQGIGYAIALVFFGGTMFTRGYLILQSSVVPRWLGAFLMVEGVAYWANTFVTILAPGHAATALGILMGTALAEVALCLWLLVKGVNAGRWQQLRARPV